MWSLADATPERLHGLAHDIETSGRWTSFLTPQEHQIFEAALNHNLETWGKFLKGGIPCQLRFAGSEEGSSTVTEMDPVTLAFRVRYMLWESQIDKEGSFSGTAGESAAAGPEGLSGKQDASNGEAAKKDSDDDYDDDLDDDDTNQKPGDEPAANASPLALIIVDSKQEDSEPDLRGRNTAVLNSSIMYDLFDQDQKKMLRFQRLKDSDEQIQRDNEDDDPPLSAEFTNYSNLGNGVDAEDSGASGLAAFAKTAQFGSANLCLKHLLTTIETKRAELQVTDIELRNLISDVRKNRSKWASEERIGQEELYEACERVVQELRGTTEHSTAFLNKVSKREAPNYYEVIKNPMDLNTIMRKLRALQYNSKKEFVDDLNLIWSNCLTYNSDPAHFLRVHALAMRKKTEALAPLIPDVTIRSRAEVEAEAERLEKEARENRKRRDSDSDTGHKHGSKRKKGVTPAKFQAAAEVAVENGKSTPTSKDATQSPVAAAAAAAGPAGPPAAAGPAGSADPSSTSPAGGPAGGPTDGPAAENHEPSTSLKAPQEEQQEVIKLEEPDSLTVSHKTQKPDSGATDPPQGDASAAAPPTSAAQELTEEPDATENLPLVEEEYQIPDVESSFWNNATRRRRIQCILGRKGLFTDNKLQMDAPITVRTPGSMLRFDRTIKGEDMIGQMGGISLLSTDMGKEPFMIEYEANAGIPQSPLSDQSEWISAPIPKLQDLSPSKYLARGIVNELFMRNLNEMQMIRRYCAKILYIKDLQSGQIAPQHDTGAAGPGGTHPEYPKVDDPEEDISSRLPGSLQLDKWASLSSMRRTVSKLAMQAGFEAAQPRAMDVLTSIAGDYLMKLSETLVANLEAPDSTASCSSVIAGSLDTMGVTRMSQLSKYIADEVLRQGRRLMTFRKRLNTMLIDILRPEVERYQDEQFQDNSEQFVLGQFSNELGDDYFGFKELGINEDLGVTSIAVPFHLLQQRVAYQESGIPQHGIRRKLGLDVPEYPPLRPGDIEAMPPLFRSSFAKMLLKYPLPTSASDEQKPALGVLDPHTEPGREPHREPGRELGTEPSKEPGTEPGAKPATAQEQAAEQNAAHIAQLAAQVAQHRAKVPTSGKLVPRKKRFDRAYIVVKPDPSPPEPEALSEAAADAPQSSQPPTSEGPPPLPSDEPPSQALRADGPDLSDPEAELELNDQIGSLAFENESAAAANGFSFEDSAPTGSLMLQADDEDEPDAADPTEDLGFSFVKK